MVIGSRQCTHGRTLHLFFNDIALRQVSTMKYLGVYIDQHLTWKCHVEYLLWRAHGKLYSFNCLRFLTDNLMKILYQAHILPIINYHDVVWVPTNSSHLKKLERVQLCFVSTISTNCPVFKLTLIEWRRFHIAIEIHKILMRRSPSYLLDTFKLARVYVAYLYLLYAKIMEREVYITVE